MIAVLVICSAFYTGWTVREWRCDALVSNMKQESAESLAIAQANARRLDRLYQDAADKASDLSAQLKIEREKGVETVEKEVIRYVKTRDHCTLDADWGRLHNLAACLASGASESTCRADGAPASVGADTALKVVTNNYVKHCGKLRDQVLGWQDFYGRLKANSRTE